MKKIVAVILLVLGVSVSGLAQATAPGSDEFSGITKLKFATVLVRDYDEALKWYTEVLGFEKVQDQKFGAKHRWIVVAPKDQKEIGMVLAVAQPLTPDDKTVNHMDRMGKETNWVFQANDVRKLYERLSSRGVKFLELPADKRWGTVQAVFEDLYGNIFVVEGPQRKTGNSAATQQGGNGDTK